MKKYLLLILVLSTCIFNAAATHNRAGEITYKHLSGFTYKITITTYTKASSTSADKCELLLQFGDGDSAIVVRNNGPSGSPCSSGIGNGELLGNDVKKNIYETVHTYSGSATYIITMEDPNRNEKICNVPNSINTSFSLRTELVINPFLGDNSSPILLIPPIDNACVGECFEHNPGAFDADGDSLVYTLVSSFANGSPIFAYSLPPNMSVNDIDPLKGDIRWCAPPTVCQYNVAILIEEYRKLPGSSTRFYIGSVLRDMQINVESCFNEPPEIASINDTCITAGESLNFDVITTDSDASSLLTLTATGGPLNITPTATFTSSITPTTNTGSFSWAPNCSQVQALPYLVTFKVTDDNFDPLANFESVFIHVIAPAPTGLTAEPAGASIKLDWDAEICNDTLGNNQFIGYAIYRKNACDSLLLDKCVTGVPSSTGYKKIGETSYTVTAFTDNNDGQGLINGINYSYAVVAEYSDGAQSYASNNVCAKLVRDVPIITNVSVISTGTQDSIWTYWVKPIGSTDNLDTIANPPPYEYRLLVGAGLSPAAYIQIATYIYPSFSALTDTGFVSAFLNTQDSAFTFRVDFYSNSLLVGSTNTASSVFLSSSPTDNQINLSWEAITPWANYRFDVYRETLPGAGTFDFIDSTTSTTFADTGLVNGQSYCYKVVSIGQYSDTALPRPLINHSQIKCDVPIDIIPPCEPTLTVSNSCDTEANTLNWLNPNTYCSDDGMKYFIYFASTSDAPLVLIDSILDINIITFSHQSLFEGVPSLAGCYAVTAIDSTGNESLIESKQCVDNCPVYDLPNVFTPNGDGYNDLFTPLIPYKHIKDISMQIYNRWGVLMFETTDSDILWDGTNRNNKQACTDGVYFYIVTVNEIRVDGIIPQTLKGFIQLFNEK